jgi:cobyrinic acid a,c-diamide synthase
MSNTNKHSFLVAAPRSNSGKTLVTLGLIKALCRKNKIVQPYKCGPDYIDPMHHSLISGRPSYNLDTWMENPQQVKKIFTSHLQDADVGAVEGVMGLFDGAQKDKGSSAEIARLLSLPIVLVVDASSVAYSVAPLLHGFKHFDNRIQLAGVIFNKTGSDEHVCMLKEAATDAGVTTLGHIPRDKRLAIESRHLGLHLPEETGNSEIIDIAADLIEKYINLDSLLKISRYELHDFENAATFSPNKKMSIAVAHDKAFNFTYRANFDALQALGEVQFFSPLADTQLPDADIIWLPGGYPELFAKELSANIAMHKDINAAVVAGKTIIAECGGMMYLGKTLIDKDSQKFEMTGIFDFVTSFENMKIHLGYRQVDTNECCIKGHEFHYSALLPNNDTGYIKHAKTARGKEIPMPIFKRKNCWASYMHLYLGIPEKMYSFLNSIMNKSIAD